MSYTLDPLGQSLQNTIIGESATLNLPAGRNYLFVVPPTGPYFEDSMLIKHTDSAGVSRILEKGIDWNPGFQFVDATQKCNRPIYGCINFVDITLDGSILINYKTLGGTYILTAAQIASIQSLEQRDPTFTSWEKVLYDRVIARATFPTVDHSWSVVNVDVVERATAELEKAGLIVNLRPKFLPEPGATVYLPTKAEVGLPYVDNFKTATAAEAAAGTATDLFMTPAGTKAAVNGLVDSHLTATGYQVPIAYVAGLTVNDSTKSYKYKNSTYVPRPEAIPFVTNGSFEKDKFSIVNSDERNHWVKFGPYTVTGAETIDPSTGFMKISTGLAFSSRVNSKLIINDVVEAVFNMDYHVDDGILIIEYPLDVGDKFVVYFKETSSKNADDRNYYKTFKVTSGVTSFTLAGLGYLKPDDLRVTLNDFVILTKDVDYTITGNILSITYTLKLGDLIEVENIDNIPFTGKFPLRSLLFSSKSSS